MTFVDDSSRSIIIVLWRSERQVVELRVQNLIKKQINSREKNYTCLNKHSYIGEKTKPESKIDYINTKL